VTNAGTSAAESRLDDTVYLSTDQTYSYSDFSVVSREHTGDCGRRFLHVNATVNSPRPRAYLVAYTDVNSSQPESNDSNTRAHRRHRPYLCPGDLTVTTATAPSTANAGQSVTLSWTVTNGNPARLPWFLDRLHLSVQ